MSVDPEKYDDETKKKLADTNMENYGGKDHRDKQKRIAETQKEWKDVKKLEPGQTLVWRIEKFRVKAWPKDQYGDFFNGDSYIVLHCYKEGDKETKLYNAHFWLGSETSQDEAGAAAIKTVELDDLLGDLPVQYREVEGHESKHFMRLFGDMNILKGGVDSGFRKVEPKTYKPRLIHITGNRKKMKNHEVEIDVENLNDNDAFVLDLGLEVFQFRPPKANAHENRACNQMVNKMSEFRNGRIKEKHIIEWDDDSEESKKFWSHFKGGKPEKLPKVSKYAAAKAKEEDSFKNHVNKLYHITDESGELEITLKQEGKLDKGILAEEDDDVIIIDVGRVVFVWVGSTANKNELSSAMKHACDYLKKTGRPMWTPIERVQSGREPKHFWKAFGVTTYKG